MNNEKIPKTVSVSHSLISNKAGQDKAGQTHRNTDGGLKGAAAGGLSERQPANVTLEPWTAVVISPRTAGLKKLRMVVGYMDSWPSDSWHSPRSRQTPTPTCSGLRRDDEQRLPCRGTHKNRNKQKTNKTSTR